MLWNQSLNSYLDASPELLKALAAKDHNLDLDSYDRRAYDELLEAAPAMKKLAAARDKEEVVKNKDGNERPVVKESKAWRSLLRDVWGEFFKSDTDLLQQEQVDPSYRANRHYLEKMNEDPTTAQARLTTRMDELASGLAAMEAGQTLLSEIKERPELQKAMEAAEAAQEAAENGDAGLMEESIQKAGYALYEGAQALRRAARAAMEAGQEKAEQLDDALRGWGLEPGDLTRVPLEERLKLAERLMVPKLKMLADLVGRFRNLARARQKHKVEKGRDEIHGITLGRDIGRLLPAELAALTDPTRELDFYRRYNDGSLLQYQLKSKEKLGRGPMVVLVDISGSMSGQPLDWAIAVALGMVDTAYRQKRAAAVAFFDTEIKQTFEFSPGEKNIDKLLEMAGIGAAGGTDYMPALQLAIEKIQSQAYQRADVVMVTDGICRLPDDFIHDFLVDKKTLDFKVWSVLIGHDPGGELKRWSDQVWPVSRLTEDAAGEVFERVF